MPRWFLSSVLTMRDSTCKAETGGSNPQRGRANNSVVIVRNKIQEEKFKPFEESGSLWQRRAGFSLRMMGVSNQYGISIMAGKCCNLTEVNVSNVKSQDSLNERAKAAAFVELASWIYRFPLSAGFLEENYRKEALIGVGMTGIGSGAVLQFDLEEAANCVKKRMSV